MIQKYIVMIVSVLNTLFKLRILVATFLILFSSERLYAQNIFYLIELKVIDSKTSLAIENAEINIMPVGKKIKTGDNGTIKLILPPGASHIDINHNEYLGFFKDIYLRSDTSFIFEMEPFIKSYLIKDIVIKSKFFDKVNARSTGLERLNISAASKLPAVFSEMDIVRNIALLPGTSFSTEAATDLSVRGGLPDQNLFLFDNATLYSSSYLLGLISPFQSSVLEEVDFHKGFFPARLGGRCSSVIETFSKQSFTDKIHGEIHVGFINSSIYTAIPISKDKVSIFVGARSTYLDLLQKLITSGSNVELTFRDLFAKSLVRISEKTKGSVSILTNYDSESFFRERGLLVKEEMKTQRKNLLAQITLETKMKNSNNLFNLYYSSFNNGLNYTEKYLGADSIGSNFIFNSEISELTVKNHFEKNVGDWGYNAGIQSSIYQISPFDASIEIERENIFNMELAKHLLFENDLFAGLNYSIIRNLSTDIGLRFSSYNSNNHFFIYPELRTFLQYKFNDNTSVKAAYSKLTQGLHLLKNSGIGMQFDIWVPSTNTFKPQSSSNLSLGIYRNIELWNMSLGTFAELYYKTQNNIISYIDGYNSNSFIFRNSQLNGNWENAITSGKSKSWGLELSIDKQAGEIQGAISYTLAWAYHQFDMLNQGKIFPSPYDRRHNFSISGNYSFKRDWDLGVNWVFASGAPITLPIATYNSIDYDLQTAKPSTPTIWDQYPILMMNERNSFRMKPYHRLDLSLQRNYKLKKNRKGILKISIYNVYNRKNPYFYYLVKESGSENSIGQNKLYSASILPVIPTLSYTYIF
jgi:hypothetical protein